MLLTENVDYTHDGSGNYTFGAHIIGRTVTVTYQGINASPALSALEEAGLSLASGTPGQPVWGFLSTNYPSEALGYSGFAYVYAPSYDLGDTADVVNHTFEVSTPWEQSFSADADPGAVINDMLTNGRYGANFPVSRMGSMADVTLYARAQGLLMSPVMAVQKPGAEWLRYFLDMCNSDCTWSQATLKFVPLGDKAVTGNGVTYTPNTTPVYILTEDHFIVSSPDEDAVQVFRKSGEDSFNHVRVEYRNRANDYNLDIVEAKDAADIDYRGLRTMATIEAHAVCDTTAARALATLALHRQMSVRNTYRFTLPWSFVMADPLDLLSLTYAPKGLESTPVRVVRIEERDDGDFDFECEDAPIGMSTAPAYGAPAGSGFSHDYNASPGSVTAPIFFEAPIERTADGLEVYAAVGGSGANWGGCRVWVALDGETSYREVGRLVGSSRYGHVAATLSAAGSSVQVQLNSSSDALLAGSAGDAAALNTLIWIAGSSPGGEYLAYVGASLTGPGAYILSGLVRGAFDSPVQEHPTNSEFVRVDNAIAKSGPIDVSYIGTSLNFKFTSFNLYGLAEQTLDEVVEYPYVITGAMVALPPPNFDFFNLSIQPDGTRQFEFAYVSTPRPVDFLGAQIRYVPGHPFPYPAFDDMNRLDDLPDTGFYSQSPLETNALLAGDHTFALRAIDTTFNGSSVPLYITATLPDRRLGNVFDEFFEHSEGWLGTKTGCSVRGGILEANDSSTWASIPATWDAWTRWNTNPTSPIVYQTPDRDFGTTVAGQLNSTLDVDGIAVQELSTSTDGVSWSAWGSAALAFSARYIRLRVTVTATGPEPVPTIRTWSYQVNAQVRSENINDIDISALTGSYRIGVGDIRIPLTGSYSVIKRTSVVVQDNTAGSWSATRIDQSLSPAPRWQFRLNGVLTDPALVDFYVEGY